MLSSYNYYCKLLSSIECKYDEYLPQIIHAGTVENEGKVLTTGGRVLGVTVLADTAVSAFTKVCGPGPALN